MYEHGFIKWGYLNQNSFLKELVENMGRDTANSGLDLAFSKILILAAADLSKG